MAVRLTRPAEKALKRLPRDVGDKVRAAIRSLAAEPTSGSPLKGSLEGKWSYRVGRSYRIIYQFAQDEVIVRSIGHRRDVYRSA